MKCKILLILFLFSSLLGHTQYSRTDSLIGTITAERSWWDLKYYNLQVEVDADNKFFKGQNTVHFKALESGEVLQIDLQPPMRITAVYQNQKKLTWIKDGPNAHLIQLSERVSKNSLNSLTIHFEGHPKEAANAPWDGGVTWSQDENGDPFIATSNQGIGSSIWWPCKDHPADEVDSLQITVKAPKGLRNVSNGRLRKFVKHSNGQQSSTWFVSNPINNYGVNINIAKYVDWADVYQGEAGPLDVSFYVLKEDLEKAKIQFKQAFQTLEALEHWFGPYPFYKDGYKLVQVPYLGMEHQSSVTYGNGFTNGYKGTDLSKTGWGLKWDFIIVHESGHEWFANNITSKDKADMWIHESFTNYCENLFTEYFFGKKAGAEYVIGTRANVINDRPIIGDYNVSKSGSSDMYYKGGNMLHTLRQWISMDELWRGILRSLNKDFRHQTVTTAQIENYIAEKSGLDLNAFFNQYLRTVDIPTLEWKNSQGQIQYRYIHTVKNFNMPLRVNIDGDESLINPSPNWQMIKGKNLIVDTNFYVNSQKIE